MVFGQNLNILSPAKRLPSERAPQEEQNGANFSSIAPSSEESHVILYTHTLVVRGAYLMMVPTAPPLVVVMTREVRALRRDGTSSPSREATPTSVLSLSPFTTLPPGRG